MAQKIPLNRQKIDEIIVAGSGDMLKSVYDSDEDGKVNIAATAETVEWTGVQNKPAFLAFEGFSKITVHADQPSTPSSGDLWVGLPG